jgi:hypothetical protein
LSLKRYFLFLLRLPPKIYFTHSYRLHLPENVPSR